MISPGVNGTLGGTHKQLSPLEKVNFDNFFKCNHVIIKWRLLDKELKTTF